MNISASASSSSQPHRSRLYPRLLLCSSLLTVGLLLFAAFSENYLSEWQTLQRQYRAHLEQKAVDDLGRGILRDFRIELKQISVPTLHAVDRCVSCHTGIDDPRMRDLPQPFRTHSGDILLKHPADRFGCTVCHQGQGLATTYRDAAHRDLEFWERPMLKGAYLQASCAKCHVEPGFPGTPLLAAGRALYEGDFSCSTCHRLRGEGGRDCPDLTFIGSKSLRSLDFTFLPGERTRERWLFAHFKNPPAVVPRTEMPNMEMTDEQATALTALMLSLTDDHIPSEFIAKQAAHPPQGTATDPADRAFLQQSGCLACHSVAGQGGKSGPDLSTADVRRSAAWLVQHFKNPNRTDAAKDAPGQRADAPAKGITKPVLARERPPGS